MPLFKDNDDTELSRRVLELVKITTLKNWTRKRGGLQIQSPAGEVWFYLDYTMWMQGGSNESVGAKASRELWKIHDALRDLEAHSARETLGKALLHYNALSE